MPVVPRLTTSFFRSGHTSPSRQSGRDGDVQNTADVMEGRREQIHHPSLTGHRSASKIDVTTYRDERYTKIGDGTFYSVDHLFDKWNKKFETVLPENVKDRSVKVHNKYPDKRLIIHFMQPHIPYLGSTARDIRNRVNLTGYGYYTTKKQKDNRGKTWWAALEDGEITEEEIIQAYSETLDIVISEAKELIETLGGKSIVTADHGEMLGERGLIQKRYAHPHDIYNDQLRIVPWFVPPVWLT